MARYLKPNGFVTRVANPALSFLIARFGLTPAGAHLLEVRGRRTGQVRTVPVNPLTYKRLRQ